MNIYLTCIILYVFAFGFRVLFARQRRNNTATAFISNGLVTELEVKENRSAMVRLTEEVKLLRMALKETA
jgi:hypothetical protein